MEYYRKLLENNKEWVENQLKQDPEFFTLLSKGQTPSILWVGCSDSRVPAEQITNTQPGEIFVHRNIANMIIHTDMNMLSVLDYAVNHIKVSHVIVCGHYDCGGIRASLSQRSYGSINNWLLHLKDVYRNYQSELDAIMNDEQKERRFVELNIREQVYNVAKTSIIQKSWKETKMPYIHGWVYDVATGLINDLELTVNTQQKVKGIFKFNFDYDEDEE